MKNYATGIQHIGIPTKDMEATKAFFAKLGFEPAFETVNEGAKVAFLKLENLVIETYESDEATMKAGAILVPSFRPSAHGTCSIWNFI